MSDIIAPIAGWCATLIEAMGISVIVFAAIYGVCEAGFRLLKHADKEMVYQDLRLRLGRGILLGLEFLIAADIIYTVAVELTFATIGVLALVIMIRTFLSFTLEVELTGKWPWQRTQ